MFTPPVEHTLTGPSKLSRCPYARIRLLDANGPSRRVRAVILRQPAGLPSPAAVSNEFVNFGEGVPGGITVPLVLHAYGDPLGRLEVRDFGNR
jgi:hypothetical protein